MEKAELTKEREAASVAEAPTSVCKYIVWKWFNANVLFTFVQWLVFRWWKNSTEFVWVKKARNFLYGLWKAMENDKKWLVCEQKSYKYFKIGMIGIFPCNSLRVLVVLWEGTA